MVIKQSIAYDQETYAVIGAAMEVHRQLGLGFLENVYQEALAIELGQRLIPYATQVELPVVYKQHTLRITYRADFVAFDDLLIEIKALDQLSGRERAQVLNYLKAAKFRRGLLLNFGSKSLQHERFVWG
jgi:GxxExxY protein